MIGKNEVVQPIRFDGERAVARPVTALRSSMPKGWSHDGESNLAGCGAQESVRASRVSL